MANVLQTQNIWYLDTEGVITARPVRVQKVVLIPNSAADAATFTSWGARSSEPTVRTTMADKTVTTTLTTTITSTGNFQAAEVVVNDVIDIYKSSSGNNIGEWQVGTRSSDDAIIVDIGNATLTNEASKIYSWKIWKPAPAFKMVSPGTEKVAIQIDFGNKGFWFPNLAMHTLSASAVVYLYVL